MSSVTIVACIVLLFRDLVNDRTAAQSAIAIRLARADDFPTLQDIELDAGRLFAEAGMPEVASDDPFSFDELLAYQRDGRAWVAVDADDAAIGYVVVDVVDANVHIEQISVRPAFGRRGIGRALIEHVVRWAHERGCPALTLTTFRDVAFNAPYYERCGFHVLRPDEISPGLAAIRRHEAEVGLDRWSRVCMRREVEP